MWSGSGRWRVGEDGGLCAKADVQKGLGKCQLTNEWPVVFVALQTLLVELSACSRHCTVFIVQTREGQSITYHLLDFYSARHTGCVWFSPSDPHDSTRMVMVLCVRKKLPKSLSLVTHGL